MVNTRKPARSAHSTVALCHLLDSTYARRRDIRAGTMFGYRAYFVGKRLFACVLDGSVCLRLGPTRAARALAEGGAAPFRPHGRIMRGWVEVTAEQLATRAKSGDLLVASLAWARRLEGKEAR